MFFIGKCAFWLSVVALAMPGAEADFASMAASPRAAAVSGQLAGLGAACLAAPACRNAVLEHAAENFVPAASAPKAKPLKAAARPPAPAAKLAALKPPRATTARSS